MRIKIVEGQEATEIEEKINYILADVKHADIEDIRLERSPRIDIPYTAMIIFK